MQPFRNHPTPEQQAWEVCEEIDMTVLPRQNLAPVFDKNRPLGFRLRFYFEDREWHTDWFSSKPDVCVEEVFDVLRMVATDDEREALKKFLGKSYFKMFGKG